MEILKNEEYVRCETLKFIDFQFLYLQLVLR
jgi:hypothetical protein